MRQSIMRNVLFTAAASALLSNQAYAQKRTPSADQIIEYFAIANSASAPAGAVDWVPRVMIHPDTFTAELVSSVLDGLETVALSPHEEQRVRSSAVYWLANLKGDANQTRFGIVARLERIFWESGSRAVEMAVIRTLPSQSDRRGAANVLEKIAMRDDEGELPNSYDAARHLLGLGDEGRAAILRLHSSGAIKNGSTRSFVADVVARNFQPRR